jgi:hypothetical protein
MLTIKRMSTQQDTGDVLAVISVYEGGRLDVVC